jgi:predicted GH43/DUF377 family glycosyl hydrolase
MRLFKNHVRRSCLFIVIVSSFFLCPACFNGSTGTTAQAVGTSAQPASDSWALLPFTKADSVNPVLEPGDHVFEDPIRKEKVAWEAKDVFNPAIVVKDDKVYMLYRAQDSVGKPAGTSRIGLAVSDDGYHFDRYPKPVLYPENDTCKRYEWQGGCEDPRVVQDSAGVYYMTYTAYDGTTARLFIATSTDLVHWKKYGSAFAGADHGKYLNKWTKSGSIVSTYRDGKVTATKINGKYWMYWGDQFIWAATSEDLIHWTPVKMAPGETPPVTLRNQALTMTELKIVVPTRKGMFDNDLVEPGPPAMLTSQGILLIYNGRNTPADGDTSLPSGTYSGGQVLFDKNDPTKILHRLDHYFIHPSKPYEISGQVNNVCFLEGLAMFHHRWLLYYGTADTKIAVATHLIRQ